MPDAVAVQIAKDVETLLNASTFTETECTIERSYATWSRDLSQIDELALDEADKLRIDVVTHTTEQQSELSSRGSVQFMVPIDIAVRRKFGIDKQVEATGQIDIAEVDALMLLLQEIVTVLTKHRFDSPTYGVWQTTQIVAAPVREHLRDLRQFTGILRIVFRADASIG